jgi:predicted AlkP superfamily pyrophosphatase or phosphodiesterase
MSWWHGADAEGHRFGPDSPEVVDALVGQDAELARLFAGIDRRNAWDQVTVIVVSDHGMIAVSESVSLGEILEDAGIRAQVYFGSSVAHVFLDNPVDLGRARALLAGDEGLRIYTGTDLPQDLRIGSPQRNGDLVAMVDPPRTFIQFSALQRTYFELRRLWNSEAEVGMHGFDPGRSEMGAIFFALGRGVTPGHREAEIRTIDVAPTVARLLGIDAPGQSEGNPIPGVGEKLD